jgi:D-amino peptidase
MRVYLMTDYEGVAGVYTWEDREDQSQENLDRRLRGRRLLAQEVQAAVDGFHQGGATQVIVNDGHGTGYTIDVESLGNRPLILHGTGRPLWLPYLDGDCQATGVLGAHARAGTPAGNLCHTMSLGIRRYVLNGIEMGEIGLQAAIAGHYGVPFVFLAGDAHACREVEALIPGVVTVPVKIGISLHSALARSPEDAREMIRRGAEQALSAIGKVEPLRLGSPVLFREEHYQPGFDEENPPPHSRVLDAHTREVEADDIIDLLCKIYGYDPAWRPPPLPAQWQP